jgi:hypothetical protein
LKTRFVLFGVQVDKKEKCLPFLDYFAKLRFKFCGFQETPSLQLAVLSPLRNLNICGNIDAIKAQLDCVKHVCSSILFFPFHFGFSMIQTRLLDKKRADNKSE